MVKELDDIIYRRLRQTPPENCAVVPRSTPIVAFGRFRKAHVATVSLNPSFAEFELVNGKHRFHTLDTLQVRDYKDLGTSHCEMILDLPS